MENGILSHPFAKIPLGDWIEWLVELLKTSLSWFFDAVSNVIDTAMDAIIWVLELPPPLVLVVILALIAWWCSNWKVGLFTLIGMWFINNLSYWPELIETFSLVVVSVVISIIIGVPFGIWMSQKKSVQSVVTPILDFMQTMPAFVYLIPAVVFFGVGMVPGVVSTVIFAMPPTVRLTNLGIRQVDESLIEAANSFGSTTGQRLKKVQIPLAMPTVMAGINQTIMLSLSMVVVASLVGAPGLGTIVYRAITQVQVGIGFEGGIALVILAIVLDRVTQGLQTKL